MMKHLRWYIWMDKIKSLKIQFLIGFYGAITNDNTHFYFSNSIQLEKYFSLFEWHQKKKNNRPRDVIRST